MTPAGTQRGAGGAGDATWTLASLAQLTHATEEQSRESTLLGRKEQRLRANVHGSQRTSWAEMNLRADVATFVKKLVWEIKYGVQKYPLPVAAEDAVFHLSGLPNQARILELGCGKGSLLQALRRAGWQGQYCGVDISEVAIRGASEIEKSANSSWIVSDIESFDSNGKWDVIAMIESVYYVKIGKVTEVLTRAMGMLNAGGYLLLRIHDFAKHHEYIDVIRGLGSQVVYKGSLVLILPRPAITHAQKQTHH